MKLLTCEYNGRTFAAVSDGKMVYEAAPDMYALIKALDGKRPGADMLRGATPSPAQDGAPAATNVPVAVATPAP